MRSSHLLSRCLLLDCVPIRRRGSRRSKVDIRRSGERPIIRQANQFVLFLRVHNPSSPRETGWPHNSQFAHLVQVIGFGYPQGGRICKAAKLVPSAKIPRWRSILTPRSRNEARPGDAQAIAYHNVAPRPGRSRHAGLGSQLIR